MVRDDRLQLAQLLVRSPGDRDRRQVVRFVLGAVGNHQLATSLAAGIDHRLTLLDCVCHRLFTHHMLACLRPANSILSVHPIGQYNIYNVYLWVIADRVVVLVVINILWIYTILLCYPLCLVGRTTN